MEKRSEIPGRRVDDYRVEAIENLLKELTVSKLDERYITRREILAKSGQGDWLLRILLAVSAVGTLVNSILISSHVH